MARAQTASAKVESNKSYAIDVAGTKEWVNTKIDVRGGAKLRFTATGKITYPAHASYSGRSRTLTIPMSALFLFNRPQDYGFAHGEPVKVAMSRNHLRVWKSPYEIDGRPPRCVAATHDTGFERDQRNNGVTHKIDPAIDGEREYVNGTLSGTGFVIQRDHGYARRSADHCQDRYG